MPLLGWPKETPLLATWLETTLYPVISRDKLCTPAPYGPIVRETMMSDGVVCYWQ